MMPTRPTIDIIIPSFNAKYLLEKHLPQVIRNSPQVDKIIIVDDGSNDGTTEWLREKYPKIICLPHPKNQGFTESVNIGVDSSKADFIVLINNDMVPLPGYLDSPLKYFDDEKVFAVSFNEKNSSWPLVRWEGKLQYTSGEDKTKPRFSTWASGGSAIFRKSIWDKLKGLNEVYAPAYWEDIDIGYRAWKTGYKIIWDNASHVIHEHESTYSLKNPKYINTIKQRNELLFNWLNITDPDLKRNHITWLIKHTLSHPGYFRIILSALTRLPAGDKKPPLPLSDKYVLSKVNRSIDEGLDLSIILVTYKSEDNIKPLLDSFKKSVGKYKFEVIIIDNYPADRSADLASKHPLKPIVLRNKENLGLSKAVNIGLKKATGKYILLINPDTLPVSNSIEKLLDFANETYPLGAVAPKLLNPNGKPQGSVYKFPTIWNAIKKDFFGCKNCFGKYLPDNRTQKVEVAVMAAFLIPSEVIRKVGGLDERFFLYYEDIEYCRRLKRHNLPVYYLPSARVKHVHGGSGHFTSHFNSPLILSSKTYFGNFYSQLLNIVLWIGHKWQVILRRKKFRD